MSIYTNVSPARTNNTSSYDGKIAGLYDLEETLGSGHFAVVKLARHVFTGAKVAVKVVDKTKLDEVSKAHLFQEVRCMKLVQHPNVVRLYEVIDTQTKLYLVLELGDGGDLYDYIMKHEGGLSEDLARKYFRQILRAITYCHQLHVVHRDLKPENVVFFEKLGVVKLTDFGFSNKFSPGQKLETFCGSLAYSAPEILLGDSYDAPAVDIWSLGVILYMLVCGQPPFEKANDSETLTMIMDCKYTVPPQVTQSCRKLIASMLVRDPKKRATLEQIAADAWLQTNSDCETADYLPLISRQELTEEDHAFILQKMINGNIASKEDILQSLDKNKYNHITATYFLLAEIRLRKRREEQFSTRPNQLFLATNDKCAKDTASTELVTVEEKSNKVRVPIKISVCVPSLCTIDDKTEKRSRKCSIVREEDEDETLHESHCDTNELKVGITHRESISDGRLNRSVQERVGSVETVAIPVQTHKKIAVAVDATLVRKLNEIDKHPICISPTNNAMPMGKYNKQCATQDVIKSSALQDTLRGFKEMEINKLKPLSSGSKNRTKLKMRTPSCSSSEASDDDTKARNKKKINKFTGDTPTRFRTHRRDSHDDSSDSQDQTFSSSRSHGATDTIISANNSSTGDKKDDQTQSKEPNNKGEDNQKTSHSQKHKNKQLKGNWDKCQRDNNNKSGIAINTRRRRIRESHSLDRITEAQEYELRNRGISVYTHIEQRNSLYNINSLSLTETNEEYDDESEIVLMELDQLKKAVNVIEASLQLRRNKNQNVYDMNSINEIDLILEDKSVKKAVQVRSSKCFVTMKKLRRLGKLFPVVNLS